MRLRFFTIKFIFIVSLKSALLHYHGRLELHERNTSKVLLWRHQHIQDSITNLAAVPACPTPDFPAAPQTKQNPDTKQQNRTKQIPDRFRVRCRLYCCTARRQPSPAPRLPAAVCCGVMHPLTLCKSVTPQGRRAITPWCNRRPAARRLGQWCSLFSRISQWC